MPDTYVYNGSTWQRIKKLFTVVGSSYYRVIKMYVNDGASWRLVHQVWTEIGSLGTVDYLFYDGSNIYAAVRSDKIYYLSGSTWNAMGATATNSQQFYFNICMHSSILHAGMSDGVYSWNGSVWTRLAGGAVSVRSGLLSYGGTLYGGVVGGLGGGLYYHNGGGWVKVGTSIYVGVCTIIFDGYIHSCGGQGVKKWDGASWSDVGTLNVFVYQIASIGGVLYAACGSNGLHFYNGSTWTRVASSNDASYSISTNSDGTYCGSTSFSDMILYPNNSTPVYSVGPRDCGQGNTSLIANNKIYLGGNGGVFVMDE